MCHSGWHKHSGKSWIPFLLLSSYYSTGWVLTPHPHSLTHSQKPSQKPSDSESKTRPRALKSGVETKDQSPGQLHSHGEIKMLTRPEWLLKNDLHWTWVKWGLHTKHCHQLTLMLLFEDIMKIKCNLPAFAAAWLQREDKLSLNICSSSKNKQNQANTSNPHVHIVHTSPAST